MNPKHCTPMKAFEVYCSDDTRRTIYLGEVSYRTAELFLDTDREHEIGSLEAFDVEESDAESLRVAVQLAFDEWEADEQDKSDASMHEAFVVGEYEFRMGIVV